MMGRFSKRGRNPGAVDQWLDQLGYYRKNVAYDETCLFRAVSEQIKFTQLHHEEIRKWCISYGKRNSKTFEHLFPRKRDWFDRLKKLSQHMIVCGDVEMELICRALDIDMSMFVAATGEFIEFRFQERAKPKQVILICKMSEDHYDAVYKKEYIETAGFCQSLIYSALYEKVFEIDDVISIANKMLHNKDGNVITYNGKEGNEKDEETTGEIPVAASLAPFPFKIAKALDPNIYRNIEYDTWIEIRRDLRLGDWYYGDNRLIQGTRCLVSYDNRDYVCYVQDICKNDDLCEVFVTDLARRLTVRYSDLKPESNARPWPMPYRFVKNVPQQIVVGSWDNEKKLLRRRKDKRALKGIDANATQKETGDVNIGDFEGFPLVMQNSSDDSISTEDVNVVEISNDQNDGFTIDESDQWPPKDDLHNSHEGSLESNHSNVSDNPPVYYFDQNGAPYYCNTGIAYNPTQLPVWLTQQSVITPEMNINESDPSSPVPNAKGTPRNVVYAPNVYSPSYVSSPAAVPTASAPSIPCPFMSVPFPSINVPPPQSTPISPYRDVYPLTVYPMTPSSAPVIYYPTTPLQPSPLPSMPHMPTFSTPEVPYVGSPNFIFPTPPTWYPPHVNSQGFIFPSLINNNVLQ